MPMGRIVASLKTLPLLATWLFGQPAPETVRLLPEAPNHVTRFAPRWRAPGQRRIALSLRGGSAKGLAHIGVLQRFEEEGLPVEAITGTSAGAFVAALAASGFSGTNQAKIFQTMDFGSLLDDRRRSLGLTLSEEENRNSNFFSVDFSSGKATLISGQERTQRVRRALVSIFGPSYLTFGDDFDRMRIPIRIVATDLQTGNPWVFRKGHLSDAVQASMTIPGLLVPMEHEGHQLVDGGLVENFPVVISRDTFPGMLHVGVDISRPWDGSPVRSLIDLLGRSLDTAMRQNERHSQQAADFLITPNTDQINDFDFHGQVDALVTAGRKAFDQSLPGLESLIYGSEGERIVTMNPIILECSSDAKLQQLVQNSLPAHGPIRLKNLFRLLRRLHRLLPLADAWVEVPPTAEGSARLRMQPQASVRQVVFLLPKELTLEEIRRFHARTAVPGLRPGDIFSPNALDECLAEFSLYGSLPGATYLRFKSPAFESNSGTLTFKGEEVRLNFIEVQPKAMSLPIRRYTQDLIGKPLRPWDMVQRMEQAWNRLGITSCDREIERSPDGVGVNLFPHRESRMALSISPAYESSLGAHLGVGAEIRNPFTLPVHGQVYGAIDRLQKHAFLGVDQDLTWIPGLGYDGYLDFSRQGFGEDLLLVEGPREEFKSLEIRHQSWGLGLWGRFGGFDHGLARLMAEERRSSSTVADIDSPRGIERTIQAAVEWDNLDFHALPTEGSLLRMRVGRSFHVENGLAPFQFAYARIRYLRTLPLMPFNLDLDLETGLGWNTPIPRWNTLGGSGSIIGTRGAAYLLPNAAIARLGFPFTSVNLFGIGVQAMPRVDWGRFSKEPSELSRGPRIVGIGLVLRTIVRNFNVEASIGQTQSRGASAPGTRKVSEFTFLIGTRPFDLWKQR